MPEQVLIRYIGKKTVKTDNVCGTKTVWNGNGDEQAVDAGHAAKLLRHVDVFEVADGNKAPPGNSQTAKQSVERLDALREEAKSLGVDVKGTWREERLLKEIEAAKATKADGNGDEQSNA